MSEVFFMVADNNDIVWKMLRDSHGDIMITYGENIIARDIKSEGQAFVELDILMSKFSPPPKRIGH